MITEAQAKQELARLFVAIPLLASMNTEGQLEIARAMMRHAQSEDHLKQIVQTFQETVLEWRNPIAELVRIARETARPDVPPDGCTKCESYPDSENRMQYRDQIEIFNGDEFVRMDRCSCARGDWFRRKDAARAAKGGPR